MVGMVVDGDDPDDTIEAVVEFLLAAAEGEGDDADEEQRRGDIARIFRAVVQGDALSSTTSAPSGLATPASSVSLSLPAAARKQRK